MKKLVLILMALFPVSLVAQETIYQYTTVPITYEEQNWLNLNQTQEGSNFWDDEVRQIDIGFEFEFYGETFSTLYLSNNGLLSFTSPINGCCSGELLPTSSFYDYSIFFLWTDLVNIDSLNPYISSYGAEGNRRLTIGFYDMPVFYDSTFSSTFEISLFEGTNYVFLNYGDINTGDRTVTAGLQGNSLLGEYTQLYYGNDAGSTLSYTSWLFYSGVYIAPEDPELESPQQPSTPNCNVDLTNPACIINSVIDSNESLLADNNLDSSSGESREESLISNEPNNDPVEENILSDFTTSEQLLSDNSLNSSDTESVHDLLVVSDAVMKEMVNEEKASALSDSISKDVLESALSIAILADTNFGSAGTSPEPSSSGSSSSRSSSVSGGVSEGTVASTESSSSTSSFDSLDQEETASGDASMELLETGRAIGQEALASTMSATEASASDSISQAEGIAQISSFESMVVSTTAETINTIEIESAIEVITIESNIEIDTGVAFVAETTNNTGITTNDFDTGFGLLENLDIVINQEVEDIALAIVNNSIASGEQKTFDNDYNADAELTTAIVDPALALANAFNQPLSMMNLEILGIVKSIEDKSDAEKRAEQVVAANKEQQDAINANYMDADQGGILAAMDTGTDFTQYRNAMLRDVAFYKPEDIYKNVIYRDNVRGMYFLEKGSTDTYKQMVEEQYKNE